MKITIDTKDDNPDDIKKVVKMLEAWLEGHVAAPFNMFGDLSQGSGRSSSTSTESSSQGPGTDLFSLFDNKDDSSKEGPVTSAENKEEDIPEIIPY